MGLEDDVFPFEARCNGGAMSGRPFESSQSQGRFNPTAPWQHPQVKAFPDVVTPGMPWWSGAVGDS